MRQKDDNFSGKECYIIQLKEGAVANEFVRNTNYKNIL